MTPQTPSPALTPAVLARLHAATFPKPQIWSENAFAAAFDSKGTVLIGNDTAFLLGRLILDEAEVLTLATHPDLRRQGRARALLEEFEKRIQMLGAVTIFLEVAENNHAARALYRGFGFAEIGKRRSYYANEDGTRSDAIVMNKAIAV